MIRQYIDDIKNHFNKEYKKAIFDINIIDGVVSGYVLLDKQLDYIKMIFLEHSLNPKLNIKVLSNFADEPKFGYFETNNCVVDIWREQNINIDKLSPRGKSLIRSSQIDIEEVVRGLFIDEDFLLIQSFDGTIGWVLKKFLIKTSKPEKMKKKSFNIDKIRMVAESFLDTPYLWGGNTREGFDCSGFVQKVYLKAMNILLPKNSYEQIMSCEEVTKSKLQNGDLVFGYSKDKKINHIGIFIDNYIFHSCLKDRKVVKWEIDDFEQYYLIEQFGRIR